MDNKFVASALCQIHVKTESPYNSQNATTMNDFCFAPGIMIIKVKVGRFRDER